MTARKPHERQALAFAAGLLIVTLVAIALIHLGHSPPS